MSISLKDYKGFAVQVNDRGDFVAWRTEPGKAGFSDEPGPPPRNMVEEVARATSLAALEKKIDNLSKHKLGMAVWVDTYDGWIKGHVTSIKQDPGRYGIDYSARIGFEGRDWSQHDPRNLVKDTPENVVTIAAIHEMETEKKKLERQIEAAEKKLERHKLEDFLGGKEE